MKFAGVVLVALLATVLADDPPVEQKVAGGLNYAVNKTADGVSYVREGAANAAVAAKDTVVGAAEAVGEAASAAGAAIGKVLHTTHHSLPHFFQPMPQLM
jgi:hypothetical protein